MKPSTGRSHGKRKAKVGTAGPTDSLNTLVFNLCIDFRPAFNPLESTYTWFYNQSMK